MLVRRILLGATAAAAMLLPTACGEHGGGAGAGPTGIVDGTIVLTGGPAGARPGSGSGTVTVRRDGRKVAAQTVAGGRRFSFTLPAGKYRLSVSGAGLPCVDATVTIAANTEQSAAMVCPRK